MNERIKELSLQATDSIPDDVSAEHAMYLFQVKFAELIVKECLDISYRESHLPNMVIVDERTDKFIKDIHNRVDRATRKHFGVEE